jgi:hypothetical protein
MTRPEIISIHKPDNQNDWFVLQTSEGNYELRLGGIRSTSRQLTNKKVSLPFDATSIKKIKTDDFSIYIELSNGYCIVHSDTFIDGNGNTTFEIRFLTPDEFKTEKQAWYGSDEELKEIKTGYNKK